MVSSIRRRAVPTVLLSQTSDVCMLPADDAGLRVIRLPGDVSDFGRTLVETVILQLVAAELATLRGLDIDEFLFEQPDTKLAMSEG